MIDLSILAIIALFAVIGYRTGLVRTLITLLSTVIALVLSFLMYPVVNMFLKITPLYTYVNNWIANRIAHIDFGTGVQTQGNAIVKNITWIPKFISEQIIKNNNQEVYKVLEVSNVVEYVSTYLANIIIGMLAILITWIVLKMFLIMFLKAADAIVSHIPVISTINKVGGLGVGIVKGLLVIWGICLLIPILITYPLFAKLSEMIASSELASWLYENNMILLAFKTTFNM